MTSILVPIKGSEDQVIELPVDELPGIEPQQVISMLKHETAPLSIWLECAVRIFF